jgi:CheY-like chemotaxis protein
VIDGDQAFDLILCDMMMGGMSGVDLHEWLLSTHPALASKLVFITGGAFTPREREHLNKVCNLRIEKPFNVANFKRIVNERIQLVKATSEPE